MTPRSEVPVITFLLHFLHVQAEKMFESSFYTKIISFYKYNMYTLQCIWSQKYASYFQNRRTARLVGLSSVLSSTLTVFIDDTQISL